MKMQEWGSYSLHIFLLALTIGITSLVVAHHHQANSDRAKVSEALKLASDSKRALAQDYMVSGRFPKSTLETLAIIPETGSKPATVRSLKIEYDLSGASVVIKVFFNQGAIENHTEKEQYIYISGNRTADGQYAIEWHCGARGLAPGLLPEDCRG